MVWAAEDRTAVAAFLPSPTPDLPPAVLEHVVNTHGDRLAALREAEELVAAHRPDHDWVLATVAVAPAAQGRGLGKVVVTAGLEAIDGQGGTCLLETSNPRNLPFYRRLGFTTDAIVSTPGPPVWIMTRTTRPVSIPPTAASDEGAAGAKSRSAAIKPPEAERQARPRGWMQP
jgi:GNAT superfamily N-acetyltransferase